MTAVMTRRIQRARAKGYSGAGYFAGLAPDPAIPDSPDGRFRKLNVPAVGRILIVERSSLAVVGDTLSAPDGTWQISGLNPSLVYTVIGLDDTGEQNAAIQDWVKPHVPE